MNRRLLFLVVILVFSLTLLTAEDLQDFFQMQIPEDPLLLTGALDNGFSYIIRANAQPANRADLRLLVRIGSVDEDEDQLGLAHFTEHMLFKGTKSYSKQEMIDYLNSVGLGFGGGLNAFTHYDFTGYTLSSPTQDREQLDKAFHILSEMAFHALFDEEELEEERGVVIEEWRIHQSASSRIRDRVMSVVYADSRYANRPPIGSYDILNSFNRDTIVRFYEDWYRPDLMTLIVVGDFDPLEVEEMIVSYFGAEPLPETPRQRGTYMVPDHTEPRAVIAIDNEMHASQVGLNWKHTPRAITTIGDHRESLVSQLGVRMLNARLSELAREADTPFSSAFSNYFRTFQATASFYLEADSSGDRVLDTAGSLLTEVERVRRHGFTEGELQRALVNMQSNLERNVVNLGSELSRTFAWVYLFLLAWDEPIMGAEHELELFGIIKETIALEDINMAISNLITDENFSISIRGPEKEGLVYPSEEELLVLRDQVKESPVTPYVDDALDEPFMTHIPEPGEIIEEQIPEDSGIERWKLSNGAVVYSKKTEYKMDEVLFAAISPGGYSHYPPEDVITTQNAASMVFESGFGNFDKVNLDRSLAGKIVNLSGFISDYQEGFEGSFAPRDKETFFQMLYQYIVNPRECQLSFDSYINRKIISYSDLRLNPQMVFFDSVRVIMSSYHPYSVIETDKELRKITLDRSLEIYRDRFADFSDFTFFFIGNFDEELLRQYSRIYLANLPAFDREEGFRDLDIRPPQGKLKRVINIGRDEKSLVYSFINDDHEYSPEQDFNLEALSMLLDEKFRVEIRQKMSSVYMMWSFGSLRKTPNERYSVMTMLFCDPQRYEEIIAATYAVMDSIKAGSVSEEDVRYVRATMLTNLETEELTNRYYLNEMKENLWNQIPVDDYLHRRERIEQITKESLIETARRFLTHEKNAIEIVQLPQERHPGE